MRIFNRIIDTDYFDVHKRKARALSVSSAARWEEFMTNELKIIDEWMDPFEPANYRIIFTSPETIPMIEKQQIFPMKSNWQECRNVPPYYLIMRIVALKKQFEMAQKAYLARRSKRKR